MPPAFGSAAPFGPGLLFLLSYYSAGVFFCPLTSIHGQSFTRCLLFPCFGLSRFHAVPCLVFIHLHPDTNRQCLHPSYDISLSFSLLFSVRHFTSLLSLTLSQRASDFFKTSIIKSAKTLYTFFCASSAPGPC